MFEKMGNYCIKDSGIVEKAGRLLIEKNISISSAESCTGGMFAAALTDIAGISAIFDRGIVTYSNKAKMEELGVKEETLAGHGAVSRETAEEMAQGIRRAAGTDIGVSVTGVAGPGGGTDKKPVGLVYVCAASEKHLICRELRLQGSRQENRKNSMLNMYDLVLKLIDLENKY